MNTERVEHISRAAIVELRRVTDIGTQSGGRRRSQAGHGQGRAQARTAGGAWSPDPGWDERLRSRCRYCTDLGPQTTGHGPQTSDHGPCTSEFRPLTSDSRPGRQTRPSTATRPGLDGRPLPHCRLLTPPMVGMVARDRRHPPVSLRRTGQPGQSVSRLYFCRSLKSRILWL